MGGFRVFRNDDESVREYDSALKFWSNGIGELHCPHKVGLPDIAAEELPKELKRVYDELYWEPCGGASLRYMVETEKGYGIALLNEYDRVTAESSGVGFGPLFETVILDAKGIAEDPLFEKYEIFAGERLGFDGCHELVVVFPWNTPVAAFVEAARRLDDFVYCACGLNSKRTNAAKELGTRKEELGEVLSNSQELDNNSNESKILSVAEVESILSDWLQEMRMQEGELIYAKNLDIQSDEYKKMIGLVEDLCKREFPDLHKAVFGDGAGTMDLIFRDKCQEGCFKLFYYNPDSSMGGLIEECRFDAVDATEMIGNGNYMDVLAGHTHYLSDVNSEHFFETIFGLLEMKRDGLYLGCDVDEVCKQIESGSQIEAYHKNIRSILADAQQKMVRLGLVTDSVVRAPGLGEQAPVRDRALDACCSIPGYEKLSQHDRKMLYDLVKKAVEKSLEAEMDF